VSVHVAAYVSEEIDYDENRWPCATAMFSVSVQGEEPKELAASPAPLGLPDAVVFAARHADRIIVRVADRWESTLYSAGPERVEDMPLLPVGLKLARRRAPGWEFVDRAPSDPPIEWDVKVTAGQQRGAPVRDFPQRFAEHLQHDVSVRCIEWVPYGGGGVSEATIESGGGWVIAAGGTPAAGARLRVTAATESEARMLAERAATTAGRAALHDLGIPLEDGAFAWQWTAQAYPADTIVAQINASLGPP
jgi:hypothetical protein